MLSSVTLLSFLLSLVDHFTSPAAPRSLARAIHRPTPGSVHRSASQGKMLEKPEPEEREEKPVLVRAVILGIWHLDHNKTHTINACFDDTIDTVIANHPFVR